MTEGSDPNQIVERWTDADGLRRYRTADGHTWREERWPVYDSRVRVGRVTDGRIEPIN